MEADCTRVKVGEGWRVVIPAPLRGHLGAAVGEQLLFRPAANGLLLTTLDHAIADAQQIVARFVPASTDLQTDLKVLRRHAPATA